MTNKWFQRAALLFALLVCFIGLGISQTSDSEINKNEGEEIKARLALQLSGDLPSIRTTYSDLQRFSEDITQMIVKANGYDPNKSKTGPFTRWRRACPLDLNLRLDQAGSREPKRWGVLTGCGKETYLDILDQAGDKAL